ncbi:hypothetical protein FB107DRAFT_278609 [Schizophyllum commune]
MVTARHTRAAAAAAAAATSIGSAQPARATGARSATADSAGHVGGARAALKDIASSTAGNAKSTAKAKAPARSKGPTQAQHPHARAKASKKGRSEPVVTMEEFESLRQQLAAAQAMLAQKQRPGEVPNTTMAASESARGGLVGERDEDIEMNAVDGNAGQGALHPVAGSGHSDTRRTVQEGNPMSDSEESDDEMVVLNPGSRIADVVGDAPASSASDPTNAAPPLVPRPDGVAGLDYSIEIEMGLAGSLTSKKHKLYLAILRRVRDLVTGAQVDCVAGWRKLRDEEKAKIYRAARETAPYLKRFVNDWATEEIAKRFLSNRRQHLYDVGELTPPEKYAYLKENAAKRDPAGSRRKKAFVLAETAKKAHNKRATLGSKRAGQSSTTRK